MRMKNVQAYQKMYAIFFANFVYNVKNMFA